MRPHDEVRMRTGPSAALELQASERAVYHAASRFFAAYVASGQVGSAIPEQEEALRHCVRLAVRLAWEVDRAVQAEGEATGQRTTAGGAPVPPLEFSEEPGQSGPPPRFAE